MGPGRPKTNEEASSRGRGVKMALGARKAKLDEIMGSSLRDMSARQFRELALIVGPILLLCLGAIWIALQFAQPAPPKVVAIATGGQSGGYYAIGQRYATHLKKHGITLEVRTSAGSLENIARLKDPASGVTIALLQGGITNGQQAPEIVSLGRLFPEPLWIFYRGREPIDQLHHLKGKRVAIGPEGSGTRHLSLSILKPSGVDETSATLLPTTGKDAADALVAGTLDAVFLALAPQAPVIQSLMREPSVQLMSLSQAEAFTRLFPFLQRIVLPQGTFDLVRNVPDMDIQMIAPVAALVARKDVHPAVVGLLVEAAKDVHGQGGLFHRFGEFPKPIDPEFEMSEDAERYYKAGPSVLRRNLPFWLATFIERMVVVAVPLAGAIIPMLKIGPAIYKWRIRRRLFYWYGRLKALEASVTADRTNENLDVYLGEVNRINEAVETIPVPAAYADQYYTLRAAIELVQQKLTARATISRAALT